MYRLLRMCTHVLTIKYDLRMTRGGSLSMQTYPEDNKVASSHIRTMHLCMLTKYVRQTLPADYDYVNTPPFLQNHCLPNVSQPAEFESLQGQIL